MRRVRDFLSHPPAEVYNTVDRHDHMLVGSVAVCRWVSGLLGCLRRTWRADASDRAGDVCSRKPLAFDEGRRGRGWRVRATVASPHRITIAIVFCPSVPPRYSVLFFVCFLLNDQRIRRSWTLDGQNKWIERPTLRVRVRGVRIVSCDSPVRARCFFPSKEAMRPPLRC